MKMEEWKECKLGDIAHFTTGKLNSNAAEDNGIYPFFTCSPETYRINSYAFDTNAILLAGNNAEGNFNIKRYSGKFNAYQRTYVITVDDYTDLTFLFYALKLCLAEFKHISQGTATKFLTTKILNNFVINLPPLPTQQKIATILSSLDDKIELNNKINNNLEQQAQAIFKSLFVDFEPFGGKMPEGWKEVKLREVCENITDGVHNTVIDDPQGEYYLLSCKNIKGGILSIGNDERKISKETFEKLRQRTKLQKGDILLSSVGTVGEMVLLNAEPTNIEFQRSVAIIKPDKQIINSVYLYNALLNQKEVITHSAHGAVQQCIFLSDIGDFKVILPVKDVLEKYAEILLPMENQITNNQIENQELTSLRDTLLPKLMNGEIEMENIYA